MTKEQLLKKYFGYDNFRPLQAEIIESVLQKKDCLVLMPTGGGKSICYQIPALMLEGITLVISPLIALMHDQVQGLKANGISAEYINSSLSSREQYEIEQNCRNSSLKMLYISPEKLFYNNYLEFIKSLNISLIAIDESHCVSTWGHDFRPEYLQLKTLKDIFPEVPTIALTATADKVTRKDIINQLGIPNAEFFNASFNRPNLSLSVLAGRNRIKIIENFIKQRPNQAGIIYCLSRNNTETVAEALQKVGIKAKFYHAGMDTAKRAKVQNEFIADDIQVIVATIAFGMGIDKSNVRFIVHYNLPSNVESFYQEIGRAGRDSMPSDTLLFYSYADIMTRKDMIAKSELPQEMKEIQYAKLERMKQYAEAEICRRRILLSYFNEELEHDCGNCDVCKNPPQRFDGTIIAQKALSAIFRTQQKVALGMLIDILRGSQNRNILEKGYHNIKTFGVGKDLKGEEWADYIYQLLNMGLVDIAYDEGHSLKLNDASMRILKNEQSVQLVNFKPFDVRKKEAEEAQPKSKKEIIRDALFERLRILRKTIADKLGVPPFVVFSDASLSEMAQIKPINKIQMMAVSGVGEQKFKQFGEVFINEILDFARENTEQGKTRVITGFTYVETHDLYKKGLSIAEIAQKRGMSPSTIVGHLFKLHNEGHNIDFSKLITLSDYQTIIKQAKAINYQKGEPTKPIFDGLNEKYPYDIIRLALAVWEINGFD